MRWSQKLCFHFWTLGSWLRFDKTGPRKFISCPPELYFSWHRIFINMSTPILASWSWEKTLLQLVRSRVKFDNICVALSACLLSLSCINWKNKTIILILLIKRVPLFRCIPTNVIMQLQRYTSKKRHVLLFLNYIKSN